LDLRTLKLVTVRETVCKHCYYQYGTAMIAVSESAAITSRMCLLIAVQLHVLIVECV